eukprot:gene21903-33651_t
MAPKRLRDDVDAAFGEDERLKEDVDLLQGLFDVESRLEDALLGKVSAANHAIDDEAGHTKEELLIVVWSRILTEPSFPEREAAHARATVQLNMQIYTKDEKPAIFSEVVHSVAFELLHPKAETRLLRWYPPDDEAPAHYAVFSYGIPIGSEPPEEIVVQTRFKSAQPLFIVRLECSALRRVLADVYNLKAASDRSWEGSTRDEIYKAFMAYVKTKRLLSEGRVVTDNLLEREFGCAVLPLTALIRELTHKFAPVGPYAFKVAVPSHVNHLLPFPVAVPSVREKVITEWWAQRARVSESLRELSETLDEVAAEAIEARHRERLLAGLAEGSRSAVFEMIKTQARDLKSLSQPSNAALRAAQS